MRCAILLAGLVVAGACATTGDAEPATSSAPGGPAPAGPPEAVLVVGDSIAVAADADGELERRLGGAGHRVEIVAEEGRTTAWGLAQVEDRASVPPIVVVVLGSNPGPALADFAGEAEALVDALVVRGADRVVWVPPVTRGGEDYGEHATAVGELAAVHPELEVLTWRPRAIGHPEWFRSDRLHLTADGSTALAEAIVAAVGAARRTAG